MLSPEPPRSASRVSPAALLAELATKACAAPGTWPKPFPALSVPMPLQPPALVGLKPPPSLPSTEEEKLFAGCSGSWLPWGCQMYLVVIGTLLPWLHGCCAWQRQGWSIRKAVYTGGVRVTETLTLGGWGKGRVQPCPQACPHGSEAGDHGAHQQSSRSPIGMDGPMVLTPHRRDG